MSSFFFHEALRLPIPRPPRANRCLWSVGRCVGWCLLLWLAAVAFNPSAHAQEAVGESVAAASTDAFSLEIDAPDAVRALLTLHLELLRYRQLADLSDHELVRLLEAAHDNTRELLATMGYFSPTIRFERLPSLQEGAQRQVRLTVVPGEATTVTDVKLQFAGAILEDPLGANQRERIQATWLLFHGARFTQTGWDAAKQQALRQLSASGYPTARLTDSVADIDPVAGTVQLAVTLDSGPLYRVGPLVINGLSRYDRELVERLAQLELGQRYEQTELVAAQQRLADSGFFNSVVLTLDTKGDPSQAPIQLQLREAFLQKLVFGVGASTDAGARLSLEHTHHRVPLVGWRAVSKILLDRETQSVGTELFAPADGQRWRWGLAAQLQVQAQGTEDLASLSLRLGRNQEGPAQDRNDYIQYDRAETLPVDGSAPVVAQSLSATFAVTLKRFDSVPFPNQGWGLGLALGGGTTLGEQRDPFGRVLLRGLAYVPLDRSDANAPASRSNGRIALRGDLGAVLAKVGTQLPSTQLFLTGGDSTVRGYAVRSLGVERTDGTAVAGRFLAVGSIEWQRPLPINGRPSDWESTLFVDAGAVADRPQELKAQVGVGAGVRWRSPVGPLQIDLAYGAAVQRLRLHLNVGFAF